ncbi:MAG: IS1634 family transposase [Planctomycetota bacterium]|jgi:transposase
MYIRKTKRQYKEKTYTNHLLVESVYTPDGPRQRTVCSLGDLKARPREDWLKLAHKVEEALVGQGDLFERGDAEVQAIVDKVKAARKPCVQQDEVVRVLAERVETEEHREAGSVHVGHAFWQRLGLDEILAGLNLSEGTRKLACAMVLNRLVEPKSEYAMPDWIRATALGDILETDFSGLAEDALYRAMDKLGPHRAAIESALVEREGELFNLDRTVFFYDLTSTYFEGLAKKNPKAKRGYSRDKRPDCKQLVVALVVNRDGFPLLHEVFEGNTQDRATLERILELIDERVGLTEGQTVVVDRGMAYPENIETIRKHPKKLHYIVATRQCERDQFLADFEALDRFEKVVRMPSPQNPFQKKSTIQVKLKRHAGESYVLCLSSERVEKDRAIREKQEGRLLADLAKLEARIANKRLVQPVKIGEAIGRIKERYPRVARYYRIDYDSETKAFTYAVLAEARTKAEELDGGYLLRSDRADLCADEAWRTYMLLTRAENAFRDMKSPLSLRPVFHQVERRVDTHIFLSVLAYHLLVAIEKTLLEQGVHTSWRTVRDLLKTHQVCTVVLPTDSGAVLRIRKSSTPEAPHREIYSLLGVSPQVIPPVKTWIEAPSTG